MSTMNISLPEELRTFVDERVKDGAYASGSEYLRELIREDQGRERLRALLLDGAGSPSTVAADQDFFDRLRDRARS
jgi:antitoxin ParD1/3/4